MNHKQIIKIYCILGVREEILRKTLYKIECKVRPYFSKEKIRPKIWGRGAKLNF
jgi:hypothetical protein